MRRGVSSFGLALLRWAYVSVVEDRNNLDEGKTSPRLGHCITTGLRLQMGSLVSPTEFREWSKWCDIRDT